MRLLIDSHVALWWLGDDATIGATCRAKLTAAEELFFSAVTPWELGIKKSLGKLDFPDGLTDALSGAGFVGLPIGIDHATAAADLPRHHSDPFDRMLVAQARAEALTLVTADRSLDPYDVDLLDARS